MDNDDLLFAVKNTDNGKISSLFTRRQDADSQLTKMRIKYALDEMKVPEEVFLSHIEKAPFKIIKKKLVDSES